jgi:sugar transferase (PEP-CTERM system associated)
MFAPLSGERYSFSRSGSSEAPAGSSARRPRILKLLCIGGTLSRISLAAEALEGAEGLPQRVVSVRLFSGNIHRLALLALAEAGVLVLALLGAIFIRFNGFSSTLSAFESSVGPLWPRALLVVGIFLASLFALGLYQLRHRSSFTGVLVRLLLAILLAEAALALSFYVVPALFVGRGVTVLIGGFAFTGLALTRYLFLRLVDEEIFKRRVLVWGAGQRASYVARRLRRRTDQRGFRIVDYVRAPGDAEDITHAVQAGKPGDLLRLALRRRVEEIVVAMDDRRAGFPTADLMECRLRGIQVSDIVSFLERESGRVSIDLMHPSWLIFSKGFRCDFFRLASKRGFDVAVSLTMLALTLPVSLLTGALIWLEDRGPVFYRQQRMGQNGRPFTILKFRSMRVDAEPDGEARWAAPNDPRVTRVGALIRRLRIDELPQLLNVLVGQMSFVGPRPERPQFVEQLAQAIPFYPERHFVKPGITGWAQVRYNYGASARDAREKLEFDLYYVKHHTLAFDLMVLLRTVEIVLFRIGAR